jgi:lycopene beta-cyclase
MPKSHYDYIIIGNGLAGLQLALALSSNSFFISKQIALIDASAKNTNDKTWSFWEKDTTELSELAYKTWNKANVITSKKKIHLNLSPYTYKSVRSLDFYTKIKTKLATKNNFKFIVEKVKDVVENNVVHVKTPENTYTATHVFDSRIPADFYKASNTYTTLIQHFKGWVISTKKDSFNDDEFTMMDYRLKDGNQTTFMYVLPFSKTEALVEFTYFTKQLVDETTYDTYIKQYLKEYLNIFEYKIIDTETGQIPMSTFPFYKYNTQKVTKIGTAGGWVKGSSGYSFKITQKKVDILIKNLKANQTPSKGLFKSKYKFYDKVFLQVLKDENHKGEWIFQEYYRKNNSATMFRFLDEESNLLEDIKVMLSLFSFSFIKAFIKTL